MDTATFSICSWQSHNTNEPSLKFTGLGILPVLNGCNICKLKTKNRHQKMHQGRKEMRIKDLRNAACAGHHHNKFKHILNNYDARVTEVRFM